MRCRKQSSYSPYGQQYVTLRELKFVRFQICNFRKRKIPTDSSRDGDAIQLKRNFAFGHTLLAIKAGSIVKLNIGENTGGF